MIWSHVSQLPEQVKTVLSAELERAKIEDQALEAATVKAIRENRLIMRVPRLCRSLKDRHPELAMRKVFIAVALVTGLSESHVRDTFYASQPRSNP